jgi:hypothetical protein
VFIICIIEYIFDPAALSRQGLQNVGSYKILILF